MIKWIKRKWINRHVPSSKKQIEKLGNFLMDEVPNWPECDGGAVDMAIAIIRTQKKTLYDLTADRNYWRGAAGE